MATVTPPPPRGGTVFEPNVQIFTQPWSGWFRNLYNILRPGISQTVPLPKATTGGTAGQLVFTNGILTGYTAAT